MYIKRDLEKVVINTSNTFPVVLITGSRQVGKTTLLKKLSEEGRKYVTLDNPLVREIAITDPALFLQRYSPPVLIDEIQYEPQILPYIKMYVDEHKNYFVPVWLI
ncbi:AAA family ATPase [Herbivorax sp. ANBcel31]|uniref:AAA family ATPase n=1 Tax=Herbivorax sp. ANBcel31 TaxID=3069754 RepID=UPI0027B04A15|nr:AAA family ATPase [Herbivorax sp. ANBcel31]MDQ2087564.1 AAA family ATPase [Herbivorax sp. ANBcel31]